MAYCVCGVDYNPLPAERETIQLIKELCRNRALGRIVEQKILDEHLRYLVVKALHAEFLLDAADFQSAFNAYIAVEYPALLQRPGVQTN